MISSFTSGIIPFVTPNAKQNINFGIKPEDMEEKKLYKDTKTGEIFMLDRKLDSRNKNTSDYECIEQEEKFYKLYLKKLFSFCKCGLPNLEGTPIIKIFQKERDTRFENATEGDLALFPKREELRHVYSELE